MASILIYLRILGYVTTIVLHAVNTVCMAMVLQEDEVVELFKNPAVKFFNDNQARYFTCWTFFLQWVYAIIGLVCDYLTLKNSHKEDYELNKHLVKTRDTLFSAIVFPSTLLVSSVFWGLYYIDRELIFPLILDKALRPTSNHVVHSVIVPVAFWELLCRPRFEPKSHLYNVAHSVFHYLLYVSVIFYTYYEQGVWIYPIFKKVWGTLMFPVFSLGLLLLFLTYYYLQWPLTKLIHGATRTDKKTKKVH